MITTKHLCVYTGYCKFTITVAKSKSQSPKIINTSMPHPILDHPISNGE